MSDLTAQLITEHIVLLHTPLGAILIPLVMFPLLLCLQKQVNSEEYGPAMADLEKQIAAHNLIHKEIEAYSSQLCISSAGSKVKTSHITSHSHRSQ